MKLSRNPEKISLKRLKKRKKFPVREKAIGLIENDNEQRHRFNNIIYPQEK